MLTAGSDEVKKHWFPHPRYHWQLIKSDELTASDIRASFIHGFIYLPCAFAKSSLIMYLTTFGRKYKVGETGCHTLMRTDASFAKTAIDILRC